MVVGCRKGIMLFVLHRERIWMNMVIIMCGAFLFFLLISGCILKIGRDSLCRTVINTVPNATRWDTCTPYSHIQGMLRY